MTLLRAAAATHTGYVRGTNQDLALVSGDLVAVADGMGGHLGGEVAARTAIEELLAAFQRDRTGTGLVQAVRRANLTIWKRSRVERTLHGMGTTLTAAALVAGSGQRDHLHLALVNVGDSRAYALDHDSHQLRQLTEDHSVVEEMVRQGELTADEAAVHPHRHVLTRALGIDAEVDLDIWDLEPEVGSRFLLCSDGLTNELSEREIGEILQSAEEPEDAARELVGRALGHGGTDNVTVVVLDVLDEAGDSQDLRVALVPARAPQPEAPPDEAPDITEAIPVIPPADDGPPEGGPGGLLPVVTAAAQGPADDQPVEALPASTAPAAVEADRPRDEEPGDSAGGEAASGGSGEATELVPRVDRAAPGAARRTGRSMTVRSRVAPPAPDPASAPFADGPAAAAADASTGPIGVGPGGPGRPVVLVRRTRERQKDRIVTFRVALFAILIAAIAGGTAAVVIWFEQSSYYVGLDGSDVAIYQGRPSGLLWFKPRLLEESSLTVRQLLPSAVPALRAGIVESTKKDAEQVVSNLTNEKGKLTTGINLVPPATGPPATFPSTSTSTSTSTTIPGQPFGGGTPSTTAPGQASGAPPPTTTIQTSTTTTATTRPVPPRKGHGHRGPRKKRGHH